MLTLNLRLRIDQKAYSVGVDGNRTIARVTKSEQLPGTDTERWPMNLIVKLLDSIIPR